MLSVGLLSSSLHNYYQKANITKRTWFDKENPQTIAMKTDYDNDSAKGKIESWNVPQYVFGEEFEKYPVSKPQKIIFFAIVRG
jgi:hypothetical protein